MSVTVPEGLPKMEYRFLGRSGLKVSVISLGGWLTYGGHVENENTYACMKAAYDVGINFFDCAENYSAGDSEKMMGEVIRKYGWKRNDIVVSTKLNSGEAHGDNPVNNQGLSRKHIIEGINNSLSRLGLDYVDLIYAHRPDRDTPMEEIVRAFNYVINSGKAFYWGTSEWDADEIAMAWRWADKLNMIGPVMEQPQYNLLARNKVEREFAHLYEDIGLGLTPFSPLKFGILTGKYNDGIPSDSRFGASEDAFAKMFRKRLEDENDDFVKDIKNAAKLAPIAKKLGTTQAALALAWVIKNPHVSSAITGASRPQQVFDSLKAIELQPKLTQEIMDEIDEALGNKPAGFPRRF